MGRLTLYKNGCWISYLILKCNDILWSVELHKPALFGRFQTTSSVSCTELYFWMHAHCSNIVLWCLYDACSGEAFEVARRILIRNVQRALVLLPLLPSVPGQSWHVNSPVPFAIGATGREPAEACLAEPKARILWTAGIGRSTDTLWWFLCMWFMHKLNSFEMFQWQPYDSKGHSIDGKTVELKRYGYSTPPGGLDLCSRFIYIDFLFVDEMWMKFIIAITACHRCRLEGWIHSTRTSFRPDAFQYPAIPQEQSTHSMKTDGLRA